MNKISAIVIARNEDKVIADCLESVSFCDEIIVVDDGSTDRTAETAERFTKNVYKHESVGYVEAVRKFAVEKATSDWVIFVDADEQVTPRLANSIKESISLSETPFSAFIVQRKNFYLGSNPWPKIDLLERVFKKASVKNFEWKLHTTPKIEGKIGKLDGYLNHYTHQDLALMVEKTIQWSTVEAKLRFDASHPQMTWWRFPRVMFTGFFDWYILQKGYKAGTVGIIEGFYQAFSMFVTYAKLWEMQQNKSSHETTA